MFIEPLFVITIILALADLFVFVQIANGIGIPFVVISQLISGGVGVYFLKKLDFTLFFFLDAELKKKQQIIPELWDEAWILTAACLLFMPGLISDVVGALCMINVARRFLIKFFSDTG